MATNRTFTMIKPDATGAGHTGKIIDRIIENGFTIKAMKWTQLSLADAQAFYAVHSERPFYGELTEYMSSGPIGEMVNKLPDADVTAAEQYENIRALKKQDAEVTEKLRKTLEEAETLFKQVETIKEGIRNRRLARRYP